MVLNLLTWNKYGAENQKEHLGWSDAIQIKAWNFLDLSKYLSGNNHQFGNIESCHEMRVTLVNSEIKHEIE